MPSVTLFPGTVTTTILAGGWSNPTNAEADDGAVASQSIATSFSSDTLTASNYGFSAFIPSTATILGIQATIKKDQVSAGSVAAAITDNHVFLHWSGGNLGSDKADGVTTWPGALTNVIYGSSSDLWGWSPVTSTVRDSTFGITMQCHNAGGTGTGTANIDVISLTVWYSGGVPNPPILTGGNLGAYGIRTGGRLYRHATYSFPARKPGILPARRIFSR